MNSDIQRIQTAYRNRILNCWKIPSGSRVLELGCGQGDMTVVLAEAVGSTGKVVAIDSANPDYGAPLTLGQATNLIKASNIGNRIQFHLECSFLERQHEFTGFDIAVMAHCAWYFASTDVLKQTFIALKHCASTLCFAEWDQVVRKPEQAAHSLAISILGRVAKYNSASQSNVRNPLSIYQIQKLLDESGWSVSQSDEPDTEGLQDADWEISECLNHALSEAKSLGIPEDERERLRLDIEELRRIARPSGNVPLGSVALTAVQRPSR